MNTTARHGFTAHGHHCCELAPVGERPNRVARCGGPRLCRDCQRSAAGIHGTTTDHPEDTCGRCGGPNVPWSAPSPLWNEVMRGGDINAAELFDGIVCSTCFAILAEKAGIADLWQLSAKRVHVPLQAVTPSGRTWNEQTWKWDDAPTSPRQATEAEVREALDGGPLADGVLYPQLLDAPDLQSGTFLAVSFDREGQVLDAVKLTGIDEPAP